MLRVEQTLGLSNAADEKEGDATNMKRLTMLTASTLFDYAIENGLLAFMCLPTLPPPSRCVLVQGRTVLQVVPPPARDATQPQHDPPASTSPPLTHFTLSDGSSTVEAVLWLGTGEPLPPPWARALRPGVLLSLHRLELRAGVAFVRPTDVAAIDGAPLPAPRAVRALQERGPGGQEDDGSTSGAGTGADGDAAALSRRRLPRAAAEEAAAREHRAAAAAALRATERTGAPPFVDYNPADAAGDVAAAAAPPAVTAAPTLGTAAAVTTAVSAAGAAAVERGPAPAPAPASAPAPVSGPAPVPASVAAQRSGPVTAVSSASAAAPAPTTSAPADAVSALAAAPVVSPSSSAAAAKGKRSGGHAPPAEVIHVDFSPLARAPDRWWGHFTALVVDVQLYPPTDAHPRFHLQLGLSEPPAALAALASGPTGAGRSTAAAASSSGLAAARGVAIGSATYKHVSRAGAEAVAQKALSNAAAVSRSLGTGRDSALRVVVTAEDNVTRFFLGDVAGAMATGREERKGVRARFKHLQNVMVGRTVPCAIQVEAPPKGGTRWYALLGVAECAFVPGAGADIDSLQ